MNNETMIVDKKKFAITILVIIITISLIYLLSLFFVSNLYFVTRIYDNSMMPSLVENDLLIVKKTKNIKKGDIVLVDIDDKLLIKRCVATSDDTINIDNDGNVYINDKLLEEQYVDNKQYGKISIDLPYKVEKNSIFVLSDDRSDSSDSKNNLIGSIDSNQILGKITFRIYPIKKIGKVY